MKLVKVLRILKTARYGAIETTDGVVCAGCKAVIWSPVEGDIVDPANIALAADNSQCGCKFSTAYQYYRMTGKI